jgi:hypothetical protein
MENKKSRATIYEVAKEANVSLATVSRVINGKGNVNEETAKLVRDAITKLGYIPSDQARGLATSMSANIGIVLPSTNYVYINKILAGMLDVCKIYGYRPLLFTYENVEDAERAVDSVIASRVEGIVIFNSQLETADVKKFTNISLPVVVIGNDRLNERNALVNTDNGTPLKNFIEAEVKNGIKKIIWFTHSQTSDGIPFPFPGSHEFSRLLTQIGVNAALHNREKALVIAVFGGGFVETGDAAVEPAVGQLHGFFGVSVIGCARGTFVEGHDDVGSYAALGVHHVFRRKQMP